MRVIGRVCDLFCFWRGWLREGGQFLTNAFQDARHAVTFRVQQSFAFGNVRYLDVPGVVMTVYLDPKLHFVLLPFVRIAGTSVRVDSPMLFLVRCGLVFPRLRVFRAARSALVR